MSNRDRVFYIVSVKDGTGQFLPNFRVCIVGSGDEESWPQKWTDVPHHKPLKIDPDETKAGDLMYVEGPGNMLQPNIINWRTYFRIDRKTSTSYAIVVTDCDGMACASCSEKKAPRQNAVSIKELPVTIENVANAAEAHVYDCVDVEVRAVDQNGLPVSGYLGQLLHHDVGARLTEIFDIGLGKNLRIRKARHAVKALVWKAGTDPSKAIVKEFSPQGDWAVDVAVPESGLNEMWIYVPHLKEVDVSGHYKLKNIAPKFSTSTGNMGDTEKENSHIAHHTRTTALAEAKSIIEGIDPKATKIEVQGFVDHRQRKYFKISPHSGN